MPDFKTLKDVNLRNKRALMRVDFNIPLGNDLKIDKSERWRIEASLPTIKYLIKQKAKIIIIAHLGRPKGKIVKKLSLEPVAKELGKLLRKKVIFSEKITGWSIEKRIERMKLGDILILENIRFKSGEEKNSPKLAKDLAKLGDVFINDAFAVSHRNHASVVGVPEYIPSVAGFLLEKELKELDKILKNPQRPLMAVIGGAKISTKIKVINKFLNLADAVLIGGALANTIFAAQGIFIGDSVIEKNAFPEVKKIDFKNPRLFLPNDLGLYSKDGKVFYREINDVKQGERALDIGPKSVDLFCDLIKKSKTVIWNGPLGLITQKPFDKSSVELTEAIKKSKAYSVVGGGDTTAFLRKINKDKIFNHVSTGGGAMLDYLANETLPGLQALKNG
jgi:phosphoglycerate kinase